jgi:type 1 glutamine amidotransferase
VVPAFAEDAPPKALLLSKSGGFQHGPVTEKDGQPSLVENVLRTHLTKAGMFLDATKDANTISAANLANYKLVLFYTQGDLDKDGLDKGAPMGPEGMKDLSDWIAKGGGFIGFHSAADTSRPVKAEDPATPYTAIVGGAFKSHGKQFSGTVRVVDSKHAAIASVPDGFALLDEWYVFTHLDTANMHVLAMLDPGEERAKQEQYNIPTYPIVWCKEQGAGRIFYTAMGHREDVWSNETFLKMLDDAVAWATGGSKGDAKPNYDKMIKKHAK